MKDNAVIDANGFRLAVGIIICNAQLELFLARRAYQDAWQFPQGGLQESESLEDALFRELYEEVGLGADDVKILARSRGWLTYRLPRRLVRAAQLPLCIGQKQKWFLLELQGAEDKIKLNLMPRPEFSGWRWVNYWYPLDQVVAFKREVYRSALNEFSSVLIPERSRLGRLDFLDK